jgi:hypothetical protein
MSEMLRQPSLYIRGWNGYYEPEAAQEIPTSHSTLVVIDNSGEAKPVAEKELAIHGMGRIVTSAAIPLQRGAQNLLSPPDSTPDSSIYLG